MDTEDITYDNVKVGTRTDLVRQKGHDIEPFAQCVLECDFERGLSERQKLYNEHTQRTNPNTLWDDKTIPSYEMMYRIGSATDQ